MQVAHSSSTGNAALLGWVEGHVLDKELKVTRLQKGRCLGKGQEDLLDPLDTGLCLCSSAKEAVNVTHVVVQGQQEHLLVS